ncbi:hypothetical protein DFH07DRAFT_964740 [Mycena maculata]|uniref:Uncharacterized protein n=1 Tax=Mycena maculata TaxID=230809 RepID=A0AAD7IFK9_9AGAR|nr:hypothetical protein DFH07DRAFT_964740 [Mycena maculata]
MASSLNHHHENGPLPSAALTGPGTPGITTVSTCQIHMDHHRHLESLLDSALAMLTLIRENTTQTETQNFSPHLLEVLRVLNLHILPLHSTTLPTTMPTMNTATTVPSSAPTAPATYASAAQRPESPSTPENNTVKQSGLSRPSPSPSSSPTLHNTANHIIPEKKLPTR